MYLLISRIFQYGCINIVQIYYDSLVNTWMCNVKREEQIKFPLHTPWNPVVEMIYISLFLNKALDKVSGQLQAPAALLTGENSLVNIKYEIRRTPESVWAFGERKKSLAPVGVQTSFSGFLCA